MQRLLQLPRALLGIVLLAVLLCLPTLRIGFYADDHAQLVVLEHTVPALERSPLDLYGFTSGDPAEMQAMIREGLGPWWTDPHLRLHFMRPLTSALIALDHAVYGRSAAFYHLTNVALYALVVLAAGLFYRRVLPDRTTATLAALLFAVAGSHAQPVAWIACRHLCVSTAPALLGLVAHLRFRQEGWRPGRWLGPLGLAVGMLGSEGSLGVAVLWLAYELLGAQGERRARIAGALPVLGLVAVYAAVYKVLGFGARGSGHYVEPLAEPLAFAGALIQRVPVMLGDLFVGLPSDLSPVVPVAPFVIVGLVATAGMIALVRAVLPAIAEDERRALRWLLPGALGAILLSLGGFLGSRLLMVPSVGGSALIAILLRRAGDRIAERGPGLSTLALRAGRALLFFVHLVLSPLALVNGAVMLTAFARAGAEVVTRAELDGPAPRRIMVVMASDPMASFYPPAILALERPQIPFRWHVLSMARRTHRLTRTGPSSFRLATVDGSLLDGVFAQVFRSPRVPFHVGDRFALDGGTVSVASVEGGMPTAIDVQVDLPLDDPTLRLLSWRDGALRRIPPLREGESVELRWSPGPFQLF
jgi:hypothetical protein